MVVCSVLCDTLVAHQMMQGWDMTAIDCTHYPLHTQRLCSILTATNLVSRYTDYIMVWQQLRQVRK